MAETLRRSQAIIKAQSEVYRKGYQVNPGPVPTMCEKLCVWDERENKYSSGKWLGIANGPSFIKMNGYREKIYLIPRIQKKNLARHYLTKQQYPNDRVQHIY